MVGLDGPAVPGDNSEACSAEQGQSQPERVRSLGMGRYARGNVEIENIPNLITGWTWLIGPMNRKDSGNETH